jgi:hypothetical protein
MQKREFVAAQASGDVVRSNGRDKGLSNDAKHLVACGMPILVIHRFEVVDVEILPHSRMRLSRRPDNSQMMLKLDMALIRGIDRSASRRTIVAGVVQMAQALGVQCIAEGIETAEESQTLKDVGIRLCQGTCSDGPR